MSAVFMKKHMCADVCLLPWRKGRKWNPAIHSNFFGYYLRKSYKIANELFSHADVSAIEFFDHVTVLKTSGRILACLKLRSVLLMDCQGCVYFSITLR